MRKLTQAPLPTPRQASQLPTRLPTMAGHTGDGLLAKSPGTLPLSNSLLPGCWWQLQQQQVLPRPKSQDSATRQIGHTHRILILSAASRLLIDIQRITEKTFFADADKVEESQPSTFPNHRQS